MGGRGAGHKKQGQRYGLALGRGECVGEGDQLAKSHNRNGDDPKVSATDPSRAGRSPQRAFCTFWQTPKAAFVNTAPVRHSYKMTPTA